jgi:putative iron-dependent peroxidase
MESDAMTAPGAAGGSPVVAQPVDAPLTRAAIFLIVTVNPGPDNRATLRSAVLGEGDPLRRVLHR